MTAPESFVSRWTRLKHEADAARETEAAVEASPPEATVPPALESDAVPVGQNAEVAEPFDPASLPSVDEITFNTDIRPFLQGRVPAALTQAALRQAWTSDPAIRDFIGIAEYQWDFNAPEAIPGFGPLLAGDNVQSLFEQAIGLHRKVAETIAQTPLPAGQQQSVETDQKSATLALDQTASSASDEPPAVEVDVPKSTDDTRAFSSEVDTGSRKENASNQESSGEAVAQAHPDSGEEVEGAPNRRSHGSALPR